MLQENKVMFMAIAAFAVVLTLIFITFVQLEHTPASIPNDSQIMVAALKRYLVKRIAEQELCETELVLSEIRNKIYKRQIEDLEIANESLKDIIRGNPKLKRLLQEYRHE
jgi:hypothetical protein